MSEEKMREAFEKWRTEWQRKNGPLSTLGRTVAWAAWQAALQSQSNTPHDPVGFVMENYTEFYSKYGQTVMTPKPEQGRIPVYSTPPQQQEQKHGSAGSSPLDSSGEAVAWGVFWDDSGPLRIAHGWKFPVFKEKEAAEQFAYSVRIAEDGGPVKVLPLDLLSTSPSTPTPSESKAGTTQEAT